MCVHYEMANGHIFWWNNILQSILTSKQFKLFRTLPFIAKQLAKARKVHFLKISYTQALEIMFKYQDSYGIMIFD